MANVEVKDGAGSQKYLKSTGAGSDGDPFIPQHLETNSAAIKTAVETIDNAISGSEMQVDVVAALPAGDNNIGNVDIASALPAGTNNIGDVDVLSVVPGTGATALGKAEDAVHASGDTGVMTLAVRKDTAAALAGTDGDYAPLEVDANGRLHVLDENSAAIKTAVELIDNAISGSEMQVDVVAALPAGTNNIGDVDVVTMAGTAAEGAALPAVMVVVAGDDGTDTHPLQTDSLGNLKVSVEAGSTAGTEYTEGATDASITGVAILGEAPSNTLQPVSVDASGNVNVNVVSGSAAGTEYTEGATDASITGVAMLGEAPSDTLKPIALDASGNVQVGVASALPAGTNNIGDVDVLSVVPGTGATALGKAEDAVHASGDTGVMSLAVRKDTAAALAGTDGDYAPLEVDANGRLHVIDENSAAIKTAVEALDNAIAGSEMQVDVVGALPAGTNNIGDVDVLSVVPGTGATALGKAEDAVHASGDTGVMTLAVRKDTAAALAGTDGDYAPLEVDANGRLHVLDQNSAAIKTAVELIDNAISGSEMQVDVVAALPAGTNNIGDVDVLSVVPGTGATALGKAEDAAHASGDTGVMSLAVRKDTAAALAGTDGDYAPLEVDGSGRLHTVVSAALPAGSNDIGATKDSGPSWSTTFGVSGSRVTSADATGIVSVTDAPTAGQKLVITDIVVSVDTAMRVDFLCETTGTILLSLYLPANGSAQITPRSKLKLPTADKKLQVDASVAGNITVTAFYYSEA